MAVLVSMRDAFGEALRELGSARDDVVALSADVATSDFSYMFHDAFPDRFINVGIAEQCLIDVAVGLSYSGFVPFANTFAVFLATRALEPIRTHCCYGGANVKLIGAYAGISDSFDGPTHHAISDIAIFRSLPGMTVVSPADGVAVRKLLPQVAAWTGPVYLRLNRNEVPALFDGAYEPVIGEAVVLQPGNDVTLIGTGIMVSRCLTAAAELARSGIDACVMEIHTIKPIDRGAIVAAARATGAIVTAEEHSILGGLGGVVAEVVGQSCPVPVERVGIRDEYTSSGAYLPLMEQFGLSCGAVVSAARKAVASKGGQQP